MKELSIEQKAKRYDEILARAVGANLPYYNDAIMSKVKEFVEYLLPELKESEESEDERIKKAIKYGLDYVFTNNTTVYETTKEQCLAWLEKQGEKKLAKKIVEAWKDMRLEVYQQASGNRHEPNYSDDTTKMFSLNDIDEIIEKMSEQKPADKVKPKFKVE